MTQVGAPAINPFGHTTNVLMMIVQSSDQAMNTQAQNQLTQASMMQTNEKILDDQKAEYANLANKSTSQSSAGGIGFWCFVGGMAVLAGLVAATVAVTLLTDGVGTDEMLDGDLEVMEVDPQEQQLLGQGVKALNTPAPVDTPLPDEYLDGDESVDLDEDGTGSANNSVDEPGAGNGVNNEEVNNTNEVDETEEDEEEKEEKDVEKVKSKMYKTEEWLHNNPVKVGIGGAILGGGGIYALMKYLGNEGKLASCFTKDTPDESELTNVSTKTQELNTISDIQNTQMGTASQYLRDDGTQIQTLAQQTNQAIQNQAAVMKTSA